VALRRKIRQTADPGAFRPSAWRGRTPTSTSTSTSWH